MASSSAFSKSNGNLSSVGCSDYQELRPPVIFRGSNGAACGLDAKTPVRRGSISAETKIQEELKEMKAREEELK